jgi:hypothetical protein
MKLAIFGKTHLHDYPRNWNIRPCPSLADLVQAVKQKNTNLLNDTIDMVRGVDLAIYSMLGADLDKVMPVLTTDSHAMKIFAVKRRALWTVDSHHWAGQEHEWAKHFTSVYSSYPKRLGIASYYLPPAVWDVSATTLAQMEFSMDPPPISISSLMRPYGYPVTDRLQSVGKIIPTLRKYHLSFLFGQAEPYSAYLTLMRNSQVTLNLSLDGELNARCFEAMAMGRILLTNRFNEPDMDKQLNIFGNSVVFFRQDLGDFEGQMSEALLRVPEKDTRKLVAERHCLVHRHMEIARNEAKDQSAVAGEPGA